MNLHFAQSPKTSHGTITRPPQKESGNVLSRERRRAFLLLRCSYPERLVKAARERRDRRATLRVFEYLGGVVSGVGAIQQSGSDPRLSAIAHPRIRYGFFQRRRRSTDGVLVRVVGVLSGD